jgi:hypothetical protein
MAPDAGVARPFLTVHNHGRVVVGRRGPILGGASLTLEIPQN